jgi:hypothetical protein
MDSIEAFEHSGLRVEIHQDEDGEVANPRDYDNFGILCFEQDVDTGLGEESLGSYEVHLRELTEECPVCEGSGLKPDQEVEQDPPLCERCKGECEVPTTVEKYFADHFDAIATLPIRYEDFGSGGSRIRSTADVDNVANGVIFTTKEKVEQTGVEPENFIKAFEEELDVLNTWLDGGVYGYTIREFEGGKVLDSCWGFLADYDDKEQWQYVQNEAKEAARLVSDGMKQAERVERKYVVTLMWPVEGLNESISPTADEIAKAIYDRTEMDTPSAIKVEED